MTTPREVIEKISLKLQADPAKASSLDSSFKFIVQGPEGGTWLVRCKEPVGVTEGDSPSDCTLTVASNDFVAIAEGKLNPQVAFMKGALKVSGDISRALKLSSIF